MQMSSEQELIEEIKSASGLHLELYWRNTKETINFQPFITQSCFKLEPMQHRTLNSARKAQKWLDKFI
jgi:hypothetical protein